MSEFAEEETDEHDLAWYASVLDEVAGAAQSDFEFSMNIREKFGLGLRSDLDESTPPEVRAIVWAVMYVIEFDEGKNARLVPRENLGEESIPPQTKDVPEDIRVIWRQLLALVRSAPAKARLGHVVFQCGGSSGPQAAQTAIDSYIESASSQTRTLGRINDLQTASRLARIMRDDEKVKRSLQMLLDISKDALDNEPEKAGLVLRPLTHVVGEPLCPDGVDELLERAATDLPDPDDREYALKLMQRRCGDDDARRSALWERRVDVYLDAADAHESAVMQTHLRQDALRTAEASGSKDLYRKAAAALQNTRDHHAEMIRIQSSSAMYQEEFDRLRDSLISGDSWMESLVTFARTGPLSGDYDANLKNTKERHALGGLSALFPTQLTDGNGLPIYKAETEADRIDFELTRFEVQIIAGLIRPIISAIDAIPERFGLPTTQELLEFLSAWPGMSQTVVPTVGYALQRFWVGDSQGATYTLIPAIETLVRDLILRANHGMYRLQNAPRQPGQYPGLGVMLDLLPDYYDVTEGCVHCLKTILTHPAGFNFRNKLSHGIEMYGDPGTAAIVIHTALWLAARKAVPEGKSQSQQPTANPDAEPTQPAP